ncbi:hypothetical protein ACFQ69_36570 [Streptomyces sp. NPDC056470]|uniref:hypothetical protein n=1 Tax=Streptomyces sp. NPDC056470 TaxID=3345831 RepID=UPI0036A2A576
MHALVITLTINDMEANEAYLRDQVVPRYSQAPGFLAGYWTRRDNGGLTFSVWESENAAAAAGDMVIAMAPAGVTIDSVDVRAVVASARP